MKRKNTQIGLLSQRARLLISYFASNILETTHEQLLRIIVDKF